MPSAKLGRVCLALACAVVFLLAACNQAADSSSSIHTTFEITPQPPRVGSATIVLNLKDKNSQPVADAHVVVEGNMSHAGMAPVFSDAKELGSGRYQATLDLKMAGDWVLLAHITLPNQQKFDKQMDLKGVRPN